MIDPRVVRAETRFEGAPLRRFGAVPITRTVGAELVDALRRRPTCQTNEDACKKESKSVHVARLRRSTRKVPKPRTANIVMGSWCREKLQKPPPPSPPALR